MNTKTNYLEMIELSTYICIHTRLCSIPVWRRKTWEAIWKWKISESA